MYSSKLKHTILIQFIQKKTRQKTNCLSTYHKKKNKKKPEFKFKQNKNLQKVTILSLIKWKTLHNVEINFPENHCGASPKKKFLLSLIVCRRRRRRRRWCLRRKFTKQNQRKEKKWFKYLFRWSVKAVFFFLFILYYFLYMWCCVHCSFCSGTSQARDPRVLTSFSRPEVENPTKSAGGTGKGHPEESVGSEGGGRRSKSEKT